MSWAIPPRSPACALALSPQFNGVGTGALPRLWTLSVFQQFYSCNNSVRSPLTPLQKGGTGDFLKVPLFKGDLGGSQLRTVVIKANRPIGNCMNKNPLKRHKVNSLGATPTPNKHKSPKKVKIHCSYGRFLMSISLTSEQEHFIQTKLQTGKYQSAEEIITIALRLLDECDRADTAWIEDMRSKIDAAVLASEQTPPIDGETFVNQILERFQPARQSQWAATLLTFSLAKILTRSLTILPRTTTRSTGHGIIPWFLNKWKLFLTYSYL